MAQYDGSIRINTKIDSKEASAQMMTLENRIVKTADKIASLRSKMDSLKDAKIPTQEYAEIQRQIESTEKKIADLQARQEKFLETGGKANSSVYKKMEYDLEELRSSLPYLQGELQELVDTGKAFTLGENTSEYANLGQQLQYAENDLSVLTQRHDELIAKQGTVSSGYSKLGQMAKKAFSIAHSAISKAGSGLKRFGGFVKSVFSNLTKSAHKSNSSLGALGARFKSLALSLLIFNQISKAFNAMISGMKEGFGNLYKEVNGFKSAVDGLKASSLTLKNSFAAAFRPLVEIAVPYIQKVIDAIANLMNTIGQFTAAITGQKTYTKAIKQTTEAIEDENKAQNKQLSGLDKLNNLSSGGGGGGAGGAGDMFEEVEISPEIANLAEKVAEIWGGIWGVFKEAWEKDGEFVISNAKTALEGLISVAENVGTTLYQAFTERPGLDWVRSILILLGSILGVIGEISAAFSQAWNAGAGLDLVTSMFQMFTDMNSLLATIATSFSDAFSDGTGVEIWTNIFGIVEGVFDTISNLASQIEEAWNTAGLGNSIWNGILSIINTVLGTIHNIADSTAAWVENLDFTPLMQSIDTLLQALQPLTENIGAGLEWFWNNVLLPIAGWAIQEAVPTFLNMLAAAIGLLNSVIEVLQPLATWLWENFLQPLGEWTGELIIAAMEKITELLTALSDWISEHSEAIQALITIVAPIAGTILLIANAGTILSVAMTALGNAFSLLTSPITLVIAAIALLTAGFVSLYENNEEFRNSVDSLITVLGGFAENIIPGLMEVFQNFWNNVLVPLGEFIESIFVSILNDTLKPALEFLIETVIPDLIASWNLLLDMLTPLGEFISGVFLSVWNDMLKPALTYLSETVLPAVISTFENLWNNVLVPLGNFIMSVLKPIIAILSEVFTYLWQNVVVPLAQFIGGVFKKAFEGICEIFNSTVIPIVNAVIRVFQFLWNNVFSPIVNFLRKNLMPVFKNVFETIGTIINNAQKIFEGLIDFIVGIFTGNWEKAWDGVVQIFDGIFGAIKGVINGILGAVESLANGIINGINAGISALNTISFSIPEWVPGLGGKSFGFDLGYLSNVSIPRLATGTVVPPNNEFLAVLGDNKRETEVVSPLSTIEQAVENAMRRNGGMGGGEITIKIPVEIDGNVLFELIKKLDLEQYKRTQRPSFQM